MVYENEQYEKVRKYVKPWDYIVSPKFSMLIYRKHVNNWKNMVYNYYEVVYMNSIPKLFLQQHTDMVNDFFQDKRGIFRYYFM